MALSTRKKTACAKCSKAAGVFVCRSCEKDFCYRHVAEHRQKLQKQIDELAINHDQLQRTISEQQSIQKVQKAAQDSRNDVLIITNTKREQVAKDLIHLSTQFNTARQEDDYVEIELNN